MDVATMRAHYTRDQRIGLEEADAERMVTAHTVRYINREMPHSFILYQDLHGTDVDSVIDGEIAYFQSIGHNFEWKTFDFDDPPNMVERLRAKGFRVEAAEALMVLDLERTPDVLRQPITHDIRHITDPARVPEIASIQDRVFGDGDSWMSEYLTTMLRERPEMISMVAAYVDEMPVSSAWLRFFKDSSFGGMFGGATLEGYRGRGLYTALVAVRAQEAIARGLRYLTIDASDMSRPIVEKHGFQVIGITTPCQWDVR
jgi:GNAT superfamily N-acetyltransferase